MKIIKKLINTFAVVTIAYVGYSAYNGYRLAHTPSKFEQAAARLNFNGINTPELSVSSHKQHEELLRVFYYAGYLNPENLWQGINSMRFEHPEKVFGLLVRSVVASGADEDDPDQFNPAILRKLFCNDDMMSGADSMDLLLYLGQNAFNRQLNQERSELTQQSWMKQYKSEYIESAKKLGLIDKVSPLRQQYDEAVIAGAARAAVIQRVADYMSNLQAGVEIRGKTLVMSGKRPLWAEIDGISLGTHARIMQALRDSKDISDLILPLSTREEILEEGKQYLVRLASQKAVELHETNPFIVYEPIDERPSGFFPGRTYPHYTQSDQVLTETIMVQDVFHTLTGSAIDVIDTVAEHGRRPDTVTTARDYAQGLIQRIKNGELGHQKEFVLYFQSNQPYIERQTLTLQREINKVLKEQSDEELTIRVEGVGARASADVARIHSELGALISVKYDNAQEQENSGFSSMRDKKDLQFSTRKQLAEIPPMPDYSTTGDDESFVGIMGNLSWQFEKFFIDSGR